MVLLWILVGGLLFQAALAKYTAEDARSRGHDETFWFANVLLFGIFAILIYLLKRKDNRLPESEQSAKELSLNVNPDGGLNTMQEILVYIGSALLGAIVFLPVARSMPTTTIAGVSVRSTLFLIALALPPFTISYLLENDVTPSQ